MPLPLPPLYPGTTWERGVCVGGGEVVRVVLLAWLASDVAIVDAHSDGLKCHR